MISERQARMGLCALALSGSKPLLQSVQQFGPVDVWEGLRTRQEGSWALRAAAIDVVAIEEATAACGARFLIPGDPEWPSGLSDLNHVEVSAQTGEPFGLWVRGSALTNSAGGIALVGSRACSSYGEHVALSIAADLAELHRTVISGLAYGIDAAAHRGALGAGGHTIAVMACGLDQIYPAANERLAQSVLGSGAILSELPPGYRPTRYAFLARNRMIAALSAAVVVVEAAVRSGAKNTATWALGLARPVLAVPGPITSSLSATPHRLIRDGEAILVSSAGEIEAVVAPLGSVPEPQHRGATRPIDGLPSELLELREAVPANRPVSAAELAALTGRSMISALAGVGELVEQGWLERTQDGLFELPSRKR